MLIGKAKKIKVKAVECFNSFAFGYSSLYSMIGVH